MRKAASLSLGFILLAVSAATSPAQTNSPEDMAVTEAVLRQANTIVLRQKLVDAKNAAARGDLAGAAKLYQEACTLVQQIGSGIDIETAQAVSGLASTRLTLARQAQSQGNFHEADTEVIQVLKVDPQNAAALSFKKQNDQMLAAMKGKMPDQETLQKVPYLVNDKTDAGTLVRDGKLLYEMGKLEEAEAKLKEALKLDPDNIGAFYYLNLIKQARYSRDALQHTEDTQTRMEQVEKQWVLPTPPNLPTPNPYAQTNLTHTGPGRDVIDNKLNRIRLENVSYVNLPLSEVIRQLGEQTKLRDPEKKGINFLINPNPDTSGAIAASTVPGAGGGAAVVNPATGLPEAAAPAAGGEITPVEQVVINLNLTDVRLADLLDAIVMVADHPIKYSILDYGVVFSSKGAETPQLYMRTFKVDPNTFYSGLESVSAASFGSINSSGSGSGGTSGGGSSGGNGNNNSGAAIAVVNAAPGLGGFRNTGQGGGGGGGGGGSQGAANPLGTTGTGGGGGVTGGGGLRSITTVNLASDVSVAARNFFTTLGVNMIDPPGKSVFFNDRLGLLFVRATLSDLDTIERAIQALNQVAPEVHIKARFIIVQQSDQNALGFQWYLGNFINGSVIANGGSSPSLNVPVSAANPLGTFPGNTAASQIGASANDQNLTSGLRNALGAPTLATVTGILTDPNFRAAIQALSQRSGVETLAEPEIVTISGRQTQMRATQIINVLTGYSFQQGTAATTTTGTGVTP